MKTKVSKQINQKGFTLVELLVVIVILGILAALIVPRLLNQTQQAETAEAVQMLGSIRRNVTSFVDSSNGAAVPAVGANTAADAGWRLIGMSPLPNTARFNYTTPGGALTAGGGLLFTATNIATPGNIITIDLDSGALTCNGGYTPVLDGPAPTGRVVRCAV